MAKLFVYGTLMNEEVLAALLGGSFTKIPSYLRGYRCQSVEGAVYPGIRPEPGGIVEGQLIVDLPSEHIELLDEYEGDCYRRIGVSVFGADDVSHHCETYVFKPRYYYLLSDQAWSNEVFRVNHLVSYLNDLKGII